MGKLYLEIFECLSAVKLLEDGKWLNGRILSIVPHENGGSLCSSENQGIENKNVEGWQQVSADLS